LEKSLQHKFPSNFQDFKYIIDFNMKIISKIFSMFLDGAWK
jgi:hypothetical protein